MYRFAVDFWPEAYTQHELINPSAMSEPDSWLEWKHWLKLQTHQMLEESNGFFLDWGFAWMSWYVLFFTSIMMLFGPILMCWQTTKTWKWV